ncbi:MAG: DUF4013 domain-containing protein [Candidatus Methanofastidiosum sp.]|nr:DUF4013 domain-containing protein [Methanofastidiosum sp.]
MEKVFKTGILFLLGFFIPLISLFFALGYVFRVLKATISGFNEFPDFDEG